MTLPQGLHLTAVQTYPLSMPRLRLTDATVAGDASECMCLQHSPLRQSTVTLLHCRVTVASTPAAMKDPPQVRKSMSVVLTLVVLALKRQFFLGWVRHQLCKWGWCGCTCQNTGTTRTQQVSTATTYSNALSLHAASVHCKHKRGQLQFCTTS